MEATRIVGFGGSVGDGTFPGSPPPAGERSSPSLPLGPLAIVVLDALRDSGETMTTGEVVRASGAANGSVGNALGRLVIAGLVTKLAQGLWVAGVAEDDVALLPACRECGLKYHEMTNGYCPMCVLEGAA